MNLNVAHIHRADDATKREGSKHFHAKLPCWHHHTERNYRKFS